MRGWHLFWLIWFLTSFGVFLVAEIYTLCTNWRNTLSASVWALEEFRTGQPVSQWSAGHLWFCIIMLGLFIWLTGHFAMGWWR